MYYKSGNFNIYIESNYNAMSRKAANIFAEAIKTKPNGVFGFATGGTPVGMYKELISECGVGNIDFSNITSFNLDEYYPIKRTNNQSYYHFMYDKLFNHINIDKNRINIPNGEAEDAGEECQKYEDKIEASGGIDMQILGIGLNGHIGFNEPSNHFTALTNYVTLETSTIEANARFFDSIDEVPKNAITMGIKSIMSAKRILLLVNGETKADIVRELLFGKITPKVPASILQLHPDVSVVLDLDAAKGILSLFGACNGS